MTIDDPRNNDKSVRIYHLAQDRILQELTLDVSANHASISPNGRHLVIIGDSPNCSILALALGPSGVV
ncbi:Similar to Uncharacterized protein C4G3.03; acc. no. P87229 [Pyronema omphalodes CBS 100304]|uniref:Similar to Uncharacterized protein C4G3.03 acc. no. P87229 n=1 Tax=Pyronema omphalodes (strain CBS 100304) TaxID=1076935 RepID=U4L273_PYROM|nr:Similar to Uncharacterized protein C4G3.03; acc. no. P87229 [Pyronema omphalodes CBS 100304]